MDGNDWEDASTLHSFSEAIKLRGGETQGQNHKIPGKKLYHISHHRNFFFYLCVGNFSTKFWDHIVAYSVCFQMVR